MRRGEKTEGGKTGSAYA